MSKLPFIYVHADDYGMSIDTCQRIQDCWENGCLNSISIMPNGCVEYAIKSAKQMNIPCVIHLNLVEGEGLTDPDKINLLVGANGYMKNSFLNLLLLSLSPKRKVMEEQLYLEIRAQIFALKKCFHEDEQISIDSHQHTHMIPLVFKTILRVIEDYKIPVRYLRIPAEPIWPFIIEPSLYHTFKPVNIIKNLILNFLWLFDRRKFRNSGISSALFCGIVFSGKMDADRLMKIFPHFYKLAVKRGCDLEFLFHPGFVKPGEKLMDPYKKSFHKFYHSYGREIEYVTLHEKDWCQLIKDRNSAACQMTLNSQEKVTLKI